MIDFRNFIQSAKGGRLHAPRDNAKHWNRPACRAKAENWIVVGLSADEFYAKKYRLGGMCEDCRHLRYPYFDTEPVTYREWAVDYD